MYFGNPLQTSATGQASFVSQNPAYYQASRPALRPVNNPEPYPFALQDYMTNCLSGSYHPQAIQNYPKNEESNTYSRKPNALQLPEQNPRVHSSAPDFSAEPDNLFMATLQRPLGAPSTQSQVQRNLLDSAALKPTPPAFTNREISGSQREQVSYQPAAYDATQARYYKSSKEVTVAL
ncbi:unnamed protein product [Gongylonema pulchrum]|uniref:ZM domain-containing protein n=1 Tax=Gongylonema pulchrum TaxID=637853 RepID=A0A183E2T3_9BILA|nr:unnamed protein product [Gongylonema pulchrum]